MLFADATRSLKCKLSAAGAIPVVGAFSEVVKATGAWVGSEPIHTVTNGTSEVTLVGTAGSGNIRKLQGLSVRAGGSAVDFTLYADDESNERVIIAIQLQPLDHLIIDDSGQWRVLDSLGRVKMLTQLEEIGSTATFVTVDPEGGLTNSRELAVSAPITLTDNGAGNTIVIGITTGDAVADLSIGDAPDPADTPADADALRDDLVANTLPALNGNINSIEAKINALLAELRQSGIIAT